MLHGKILWFDKKYGYGIIKGLDDNEYYVDSSVMPNSNYSLEGCRVNFESRMLGKCLCAFNVKIDLDHLAQLQYKILEKLDNYPNPEHFRYGWREEVLKELEDIIKLKSEF